MAKNKISAALAILAAALYALNVPFSKMLMSAVPPTMLAAFLYLGAGVGMGAVLGAGKLVGGKERAPHLSRADLPYTVAMVVLDIAAPILLMLGIERASSANVSLLNNFEIVATSLIALIVFGEKISARLTAAILLVTAASVILSFEGGALEFNTGSVFVLLACLCWGVENNCTRRLSDKDSREIVLVKGIFSGLGALAVALAAGDRFPEFIYILAVMALGFVAYGLSINFYILAQRQLGAAKTSAFYSVAPFLGVGFSFLILKENPAFQFYIGLAVMIAATALMVWDTLSEKFDIP